MRFKMTGGTRVATHTPDGRLIRDRQYNVESPHPHPRFQDRPVTTVGLNLIEYVVKGDGTAVAYECDECGYCNDNTKSVVSHMASHNSTRHKPRYNPAVLRQLIQVTAKYRRAGVRNYAEQTAIELNKLGVKNKDAVPWTAAQVSHLWRRWRDDPQIKTSPRHTTVTTRTHVTKQAEPPRTRRTRTSKSTSEILSPATSELLRVVATLKESSDVLTRLAGEITEEVTPAELTELRDKARQYDDIMRALGRR